MNNNTALYRFLLRHGDNALINGHRLSEWCSKGPILEEDLALTNIALDKIGSAQSFLKYAGEVGGEGKSDDDLAYKRGERDFYNYLIYELPIGDFAYTMAKQLIISTYEHILFTRLLGSSDDTIMAIAQKTVKEVRYHMVHARDWAYRLGNGTTVSNEKYQQAIDDLWAYTDELFELTTVDYVLLKEGIAINLPGFKNDWTALITDILTDANIKIPTVGYAQTGSQEGMHTEYMGHLLAEMQYIPRAYPDAVW